MSVRASATAFATGLLLLVPPGVATAQTQVGGGANNIVHVVSTEAGRVTSRGTVQVAPYGGVSAQSTNLAFADGRDCDGCRTHAVALQAIFLTGDPSTVGVGNGAVATNSNCTRCVTYAYASQYVVSTSRAVSISPAARVKLNDIGRRVDELIARPTDDLEALDDQLDVLAAELKAVVDGEVAANGLQATTVIHRERQVRGDAVTP